MFADPGQSESCCHDGSKSATAISNLAIMRFVAEAWVAVLRLARYRGPLLPLPSMRRAAQNPRPQGAKSSYQQNHVLPEGKSSLARDTLRRFPPSITVSVTGLRRQARVSG